MGCAETRSLPAVRRRSSPTPLHLLQRHLRAWVETPHRPGLSRSAVFERDRGVCALCGLDTEAMRRDKRKLDYAARRQFEKDWGGRTFLWRRSRASSSGRRRRIGPREHAYAVPQMPPYR